MKTKKINAPTTVQVAVDMIAKAEIDLRNKHIAKILRAAIYLSVEIAGHTPVIEALKLHIPHLEASARWVKK